MGKARALVTLAVLALLTPSASVAQTPTGGTSKPSTASDSLAELTSDIVALSAYLLGSDTTYRERALAAWQKNRFSNLSAPPDRSSPAWLRLRETYQGIPSRILANIVLQDSLPTMAVQGHGILLNRLRVEQMDKFVDSAVSALGRGMSLSGRPPHALAVLFVVAHEQAHFALRHWAQADNLSLAETECAADLIAGFQSLLLADQFAENGAFMLGWGGVFGAVPQALSEGDWLESTIHPAFDQRQRCIALGAALVAEVDTRTPIADQFLSQTAHDSVVTAFAEGRIPLTETAVRTLSLALSVASSETTEPSPSAEDQTAHSALTVFDTLLSVLDRGAGRASFGSPVARGVTLFPWSAIVPLTARVPRPWRCARDGRTPETDFRLSCYVIAPQGRGSAITRYWASVGIPAILQKHGYAGTGVSLPLHQRARVSTDIWVVQKGARRFVISFYGEPYPTGNSDAPSAQAFWLGIAPLSPVSRSQ